MKHPLAVGLSVAGAVVVGVGLYLAKKREEYEANMVQAAQSHQQIDDDYAQSMRDMGHADGKAPRSKGD